MAGGVRIHAHHRDSDLLDRWRAVTLSGPDGVVQSTRMRVRPGPGGRIVGQIDGVRDRDAARKLIGFDVLVDASHLPPVGEGEFYVKDLIGLPVRIAAEERGRVTQVHRAGPVDVLEIAGPAGAVHFVPMAEAFLIAIEPGVGIDLVADALDEV